MSDIAKRAKFEELRSIAFGSISGAYTAIGSALDNPARLIKITNTTDADMLISINGIDDHDIIPAFGFALYDLASNRTNLSGSLDFQIGEIFYVKEVSAPTEGSVYLTVIYAAN